MDIRPIRTDGDHRAALLEIEKLWGAPAGTPEGDKLDVMATLVRPMKIGAGRSLAGVASIRSMCCAMPSTNLGTLRRSSQRLSGRAREHRKC